jgi:response regulator NasT
MTNIIIAFPKIEEARGLKGILVKNGYSVTATCQSGSYVMTMADRLESGIVICGYRLTDMIYSDLLENLPKGFQMVLVTSPIHWEGAELGNVVFEPIPLNVASLLNTLQMVIETGIIRQRRKKRLRERTGEEQEKLAQAKRLLMDKNNLTEEEAHRFIQRKSMESGNSLTETAEMVMVIYG